MWGSNREPIRTSPIGDVTISWIHGCQKPASPPASRLHNRARGGEADERFSACCGRVSERRVTWAKRC